MREDEEKAVPAYAKHLAIKMKKNPEFKLPEFNKDETKEIRVVSVQGLVDKYLTRKSKKVVRNQIKNTVYEYLEIFGRKLHDNQTFLKKIHEYIIKFKPIRNLLTPYTVRRAKLVCFIALKVPLATNDKGNFQLEEKYIKGFANLYNVLVDCGMIGMGQLAPTMFMQLGGYEFGNGVLIAYPVGTTECSYKELNKILGTEVFCREGEIVREPDWETIFNL